MAAKQQLVASTLVLALAGGTAGQASTSAHSQAHPCSRRAQSIKGSIDRLEAEIARLSTMVQMLEKDLRPDAPARPRLALEYAAILELKRKSLLQWKQAEADPGYVPACLEILGNRKPGPALEPPDPLWERIRRIREFNANPRMNKTPAEMLARLGIAPLSEIPESVVTRGRFPEVRLQGLTLACAAFTIAAAMEVFPRVPDDLSEAMIYGLLRRAAQPEDQVLADLGVESVSEALEILRRSAVPEERECPWSESIPLPERVKIEAGAYRVHDFASMVVHPLFTQADAVRKARLLERLVCANRFPLVTLSSSALVQEEDWVEFFPSSVGHVVLVVGYGLEQSPFSASRGNVPEPYFLIRNSLADTSHRVHQKIRAENLFAYLKAIDAIKEAGPAD